MNDLQTRHLIRQALRRKRRLLSIHQRTLYAKQCAQNFRALLAENLKRFTQKSTIALGSFIAHDGELDPATVLAASQFNARHCINYFFPVIQKNDSLKFSQATRGRFPKKNRFKISEPLAVDTLYAYQLDLLMLPLVAATPAGNRLGMGGGFYDRTIARISQFGKRPLLVGIAYDFQIVDDIYHQPWDQKLDYIITDKRLIKCRFA